MRKNKSTVVGLGMYQTIGSWMLWYIGILVVLHLASGATSYTGIELNLSQSALINGEASWSILNSALTSSKGFFLICGLLSMGGFIKYFVSNGVTRLDYYKGTLQSIFYLSLSFTAIVALLFGLESLIMNIIGIERSISVPIAFYFKMVLDVCLFYLVGWFIAAGFYHLNVWFGFVSIASSLLIVFIQSGIWGENVPIPLYKLMNIYEVSTWIATFISLILIVVVSILIRRLTKEARIKD
ncbi:hypothetical protein NQ117_11640 [Paenibacillus sp. SC116]|uniref:hypothetical protein n=1 Tax=Paenibacillus sp. SC116 TaxID=2968986 RepID=UPI00215B469A|nr:hypothetical protein [Paenibacillus sp. SC116]MCR8844338.1 hypothetical protein [Paenibacillus sp. SC116]